MVSAAVFFALFIVLVITTAAQACAEVDRWIENRRHNHEKGSR